MQTRAPAESPRVRAAKAIAPLLLGADLSDRSTSAGPARVLPLRSTVPKDAASSRIGRQTSPAFPPGKMPSQNGDDGADEQSERASPCRRRNAHPFQDDWIV